MAYKMNGFGEKSGHNKITTIAKKKHVDHQKDMEDQVAGPVAKGDIGPVSAQQKFKSIEQINQLEDMIEYTNSDMENEKISKAEGRKKLEQLQRKLKQLKTGE